MASKRRKIENSPKSKSAIGVERGVRGDTRSAIDSIQPALTWLGDGDSTIGTAIAGVLAVTAIVLCGSVGNEFVLDDADQIVLNRRLGDWSFIWRSLVNDVLWFRDPSHLPQCPYYRPFHNLWLALNYHLFGLNPIGWHAAMIALHLIVVWLAFRVALLLTGDKWTGVFAAALFALMPIHAQAIVWPAAIATPLSAAFELGAMEFYLRGWRATQSTDERPRWIAVSMGLFACALFSYEAAVMFPLIIAAHAIIFPAWDGRNETPGGAAPTLVTRLAGAFAAAWPYGMEAAIYLAIRFWVLGFITQLTPENHVPAIEVVLTVPFVVASYLLMAAAPWRAGPEHGLQFVRSAASPAFIFPIACLAALAATAVAMLRKNARRGLYLFCSAWLTIALVPVFNLGGLSNQEFIHDRYLYLPSFGFCVMAADLAVDFARANTKWASTVLALACGVVLSYAIALFIVQFYWHDEFALYSHCVTATPGVELCHNRLGMALAARGDLNDARQEFEAAQKIEPYDGWNLYDMGLVYQGLGDQKSAVRFMADGLAHLEHPPPGTYVRLAFAADASGDSQAVGAALKRAAALPGGARIAELARAQLLGLHGDNKGEEDVIRRILQQNPDDAEALAALGQALSADKRYDDAIAAFRHAASVAPREPLFHYLLASTLHRIGRDREAREECEMSLAAAPNDPQAQALMAEIERGGSPH
ncbi:MAG TPA: tetratricopeptide repeat protein [Candidatus Binataceae bacterium]|nr:tetratricopeptide repeat protein [Candidatus Binataceae bacterium]